MHVLPVSTSYALTVSRIYLSTFNEGGEGGGGGGGGGVLRVSLSRQVFPLWGHFPPTNIFPLPIKVLVFPFVT